MAVAPLTPSRFVPRKQVQSSVEKLAAGLLSPCSAIAPDVEAALDLARNCSSGVGVHRHSLFTLNRESAPSSRMNRKQLHVTLTTTTKPSRAERIWSIFTRNSHPTMTVATSGNPLIHRSEERREGK